MKTIIYVHPWEGSFNHAILENVKKKFDQKHEDYQIIDLYKDQFNPTFSAEELSMFNAGDTPYLKVKEYQKMIKDSSELVFIFPIWWFYLPGILKGFFDKVMLKKFAYQVDEQGTWTGLLTNIKKVTVITTASMTKEILKASGDPIQGLFINGTLGSVGITPDKVTWLHFGNVETASPDEHTAFLEKILD